MTGRKQLVEDKIKFLNEAAFQELADGYLKLKTKDISGYSRTGSQFGKQKTRKGRPDSFIRHPEGSLSFIEHTTTANRLIAKLKKDIDGCLDESVTKVPKNEISRIILCFNSRLNASEDVEIRQYAKDKYVNLELVGLDTLATEICLDYPILAKDILGLPVSTGQILPLETFVKEYSSRSGNLATPLDNPFMYRQAELVEIADEILKNDLVILWGQSGVGKTKIGLEVLRNFVNTYTNYTAYAISNKTGQIMEDLRIELLHNRNYILLVDDANRQLDVFKQIMGVFKEHRKGKIKLLLTVRDYALKGLSDEFSDYAQKHVELNKFTDEEINGLLESLGVKNPFLRKAVDLSDGNARLAVMCAALAKQKPGQFLYGDVFELYDSYFKTFIKDINILNNKTALKTLGIFSFFFSISLTNKSFIQNILTDFEMSESEFIDAIAILESAELLERQFDFVRISEQVMATYFFYRVFIKEDILSFKTLLFNYYSNNWHGRFNETIISSNNLFFYSKKEIVKKITSVLTQYYESIKGEDEKIMAFFSLFWIYMRNELISYLYNKISQLPEPTASVYIAKSEKKGYKPKDKTLSFLADTFHTTTEILSPAIELSFEYCRKKPDLLPELVEYVISRLVFDERDYQDDFERQTNLFNLLVTKMNEGHLHYRVAFFGLCGEFLAHEYRGGRSGRKNTIIMSTFRLPLTDAIKAFRKNIYDTLFEKYKTLPAEVFSVIRDFSPNLINPNKDIIEFDLELLYPFLRDNLDINNFQHVHLIQDTTRWISKKSKSNEDYKNLRAVFISPEYECFKKLDYSYHRGKRDYEVENMDQFCALKNKDLRKHFVLECEADFDIINKTIKGVMSFTHSDNYIIRTPIDIIIQSNFQRDPHLGLGFLNSVFINYPGNMDLPVDSFRTIIHSGEENALKLWNLMKTWPSAKSLGFRMGFFDFLKDEQITLFYKDELIRTVESIDGYAYLNFSTYEKFCYLDPDILYKILKIAVDKTEAFGYRIVLSYEFFEKFSDKLSNDFDLLAKAYFQYEELRNNMDYERKGLRALIIKNPRFLISYLKQSNEEGCRVVDNDRARFGFVWDLNDNQLIEEAMDIVIERNSYSGVGNYELNMFFNDLDETDKEKARVFILNYIERHNTDRKKMNAIFDVLRHRMRPYFDECYQHFLSFNRNVDFFKKIMWRGNGGGIQDREALMGELMAKEWQRILDLTERCPDHLELSNIKAYLSQEISYSNQFANSERRSNFASPVF